MDAPAMVTRKHVPEDVGLRNAGEYPAGDRADRRCSAYHHYTFCIATATVVSLTLLSVMTRVQGRARRRPGARGSCTARRSSTSRC